MMTLGTSGTPSREISIYIRYCINCVLCMSVLIVYYACLYIHVRNNIKYTEGSQISVSGTVLILTV